MQSAIATAELGVTRVRRVQTRLNRLLQEWTAVDYNHLTRNERYTSYEQLGTGVSCTEIAAGVGRHKSTVSRELQRNREPRGYRPR